MKQTSIPMMLLSMVLFFGAASSDRTASAQSQSGQPFRELLERSEKDKKGLTFDVRGQAFSGIVVKIVGNEAVEVRNQTFSRIIIKLESIDALAIN